LQVGTHAGDPNVAGKPPATLVQPPVTAFGGICAVTWAKVHVWAVHVPVAGGVHVPIVAAEPVPDPAAQEDAAIVVVAE
jgi:hypothetical protein